MKRPLSTLSSIAARLRGFAVITLVTTLVAAFLPSNAGAQSAVGASKRFGLGFIVGEPTGLSGKYWLSNTTAFDFGAAWSFVDDTSFHLHADYLLHDFSLIQPDTGRAALFYGLGGRVKFEDDTWVGLRGVIGLEYLFKEAPVDAFIELAPVLDLTPETTFRLMGGVGVRLFFGPSWQ